MEALPTNVIAHIGQFLDIQSKVNACISNKCFASIHEYTNEHLLQASSLEDMLKIQTVLDFIHKYIPNLNKLVIEFSNINFDPREFFNKFGNQSKSTVHLIFHQCHTTFILGILHLFTPLSICSLSFHFNSLTFQETSQDDLVNLICQHYSHVRIELDIYDCSHIYNILSIHNFASLITSLEMHITTTFQYPIDINLDHIHDHCEKVLLNIALVQMSRVRSVTSIHKLTDLYIQNPISQYTGILHALSSNTKRLNLRNLTLGYMNLTHAYDTDSVVYQLLNFCKFSKYNVCISLLVVNDIDIPAFVHNILKFHGYKRIVFHVHIEQDLLCVRALQLLYPEYDIITNTIQPFQNLHTIQDVYKLMDESTQWTWHWLNFIN